jgi:hypothetical protein
MGTAGRRSSPPEAITLGEARRDPRLLPSVIGEADGFRVEAIRH